MEIEVWVKDEDDVGPVDMHLYDGELVDGGVKCVVTDPEGRRWKINVQRLDSEEG